MSRILGTVGVYDYSTYYYGCNKQKLPREPRRLCYPLLALHLANIYYLVRELRMYHVPRTT